MSDPSGPARPRGGWKKKNRDKAKDFAEREDARTGDPRSQGSSVPPPPPPSSAGDGPPDPGKPDPDGGQQSTQEDKPEQDIPSSIPAEPKLYTQAEFDAATRLWRSTLTPMDSSFRTWLVSTIVGNVEKRCVNVSGPSDRHYYQSWLMREGSAAVGDVRARVPIQIEVGKWVDFAVERWRRDQASN